MAVNKNFVVKNGLEVANDLILANADTTQVGIATTALGYTLHVNGGIGATDSFVTGFSTAISGLNVGTGGTVFSVDAITGIGSVGVGTASPAFLLDVRSPVSTGQTALYVYGDMRVTGDINLDDITLDDASIQNLTVTDTLAVVGVTTLASSGGITTTGGDLYVGGDLFVRDDIVYDEVTGRNINITGVSTFGTVQISSGIVTASSGIVTYFGDGSNLTGVATDLTATIGISSGGTQIGSGVSMIDFTALNAVITATPTVSGVTTVNIQPSVSLGLVIALGG
jgi:hypothetical protein|tara:strand:+ start:10 stop:855 length:846 start_codon:yes stop_codon:yes gene_type:complete